MTDDHVDRSFLTLRTPVRSALIAFAAALLSLGALAHGREVLRIGVADLPALLEPGIETTNTGVRVIPNVFETLVEMDSLDNTLLLPRLAHHWERLDDLTMAFYLRDDVVFHDGTPLTADDVVYSIERIVDTTFPGALARSLLTIIERVEPIDAHTVHVITRVPDPILDYRLASEWGSWIVPAAYHAEVGAATFGLAPIGTGPFRVTEFSPDAITLERFDEYWSARPNVAGVEYRVIADAAARVAALVDAEVDLITSVPPDQAAGLAEYPGIVVKSALLDTIHVQVFDASVAPLDDPRVRRALSKAIDREALVATLWGNMAQIPLGHQYPGFGPYYDDTHAAPTYQPERARELLEEAGYDGAVIYYDVDVTLYPNELAAAEAIAAMWHDVGLNVVVRALDPAKGPAATAAENGAPHGGIFAASNTMRFPDPVGGLWLLWGPATERQKNGWAPATSFNEVGAALEHELDATVRRELSLELLDLWESEAPGTVLWQPAEIYAMRDDVVWTPERSHALDFRAHLFGFRD